MHPKIGSVGWFDLTVPDAANVRTFYEAVVGWKTQAIEMEGYSDYCMHPPDADQPVAGICHARGPNADLPPSWMIYITVEDVARSVAACRNAGGQVLREPREMGGAWIAVIQDPAGAVSALYQPPIEGGVTEA